MIRMLLTQIIRMIIGQLVAESERRLRDYNDQISTNKDLKHLMESGALESYELPEPEQPVVIEVVDERKLVEAFMEPFNALQRALEEDAEMVDVPGVRIVRKPAANAPTDAPKRAKATGKPPDTVKE